MTFCKDYVKKLKMYRKHQTIYFQKRGTILTLNTLKHFSHISSYQPASPGAWKCLPFSPNTFFFDSNFYHIQKCYGAVAGATFVPVTSSENHQRAGFTLCISPKARKMVFWLEFILQHKFFNLKIKNKKDKLFGFWTLNVCKCVKIWKY